MNQSLNQSPRDYGTGRINQQELISCMRDNSSATSNTSATSGNSGSGTGGGVDFNWDQQLAQKKMQEGGGKRRWLFWKSKSWPQCSETVLYSSYQRRHQQGQISQAIFIPGKASNRKVHAGIPLRRWTFGYSWM